MRLINVHNYQIEEFADGEAPPYAILSHTWRNNEVSFQEMSDSNVHLRIGNCEEGSRFWKISNTCALAHKQYGLDWTWIDSCCIDRTNTHELATAINSMWITRGWTLQELLAPSEVEFFNKSWGKIGTKNREDPFFNSVADATRINRDAITKDLPLESFSAAQKMPWAAGRETTRHGDAAYCLQGIFGIDIRVVYGGEGERSAFRRLQVEILKKDFSILAWDSLGSLQPREYGLLAPSPGAFSDCGADMQYRGLSGRHLTVTDQSLGVGEKSSRLHFAEIPVELLGLIDNRSGPIVGFPRMKPRGTCWNSPAAHRKPRYVLIVARADDKNLNVGICLQKLAPDVFIRDVALPLILLEATCKSFIDHGQFQMLFDRPTEDYLPELMRPPGGSVYLSGALSNPALHLKSVWPTSSWDLPRLLLFRPSSSDEVSTLTIELYHGGPLKDGIYKIEILLDLRETAYLRLLQLGESPTNINIIKELDRLRASRSAISWNHPEFIKSDKPSESFWALCKSITEGIFLEIDGAGGSGGWQFTTTVNVKPVENTERL
ncbi:hypothetical protein F5Y16DRAFT_393480 [Xylariaceae sp. FL0255]|nr:hypothetical protein F5Y16DRAFT_393480 [Xylariaceae sp. FL0255]